MIKATEDPTRSQHPFADVLKIRKTKEDFHACISSVNHTASSLTGVRGRRKTLLRFFPFSSCSCIFPPPLKRCLSPFLCLFPPYTSTSIPSIPPFSEYGEVDDITEEERRRTRWLRNLRARRPSLTLPLEQQGQQIYEKDRSDRSQSKECIGIGGQNERKSSRKKVIPAENMEFANSAHQCGGSSSDKDEGATATEDIGDDDNDDDTYDHRDDANHVLPPDGVEVTAMILIPPSVPFRKECPAL